MSEEMHPPFETKTITRIYDLKPLRTFYVLVFQPRKIREQDLKVYNQEKEYVRESVLSKLRSPIFKIPPFQRMIRLRKQHLKIHLIRSPSTKPILMKQSRPYFQPFLVLLLKLKQMRSYSQVSKRAFEHSKIF